MLCPTLVRDRERWIECTIDNPCEIYRAHRCDPSTGRADFLRMSLACRSFLPILWIIWLLRSYDAYKPHIDHPTRRFMTLNRFSPMFITCATREISCVWLFSLALIACPMRTMLCIRATIAAEPKKRHLKPKHQVDLCMNKSYFGSSTKILIFSVICFEQSQTYIGINSIQILKRHITSNSSERLWGKPRCGRWTQ